MIQPNCKLIYLCSAIQCIYSVNLKKKAADQPFSHFFKVRTLLLDIYLCLYFYILYSHSNIAHTGYLNPSYRDTGRKEDLKKKKGSEGKAQEAISICTAINEISPNTHKRSRLPESQSSLMCIYIYMKIFAFPAVSTQERYTVTGKYSMDGKRKEDRGKKDSSLLRHCELAH